MKNWINIEDAFSQLNEKCKYLILRNFEEFFSDILVEGHNDIDVLCASKRDRKIMLSILGAVPRIGIDNGIHYKFMFKGKEIALDIRTVGDGYYDERWQKEMIENRKYNKIGFYTMNSEDYFYSLVYHAIYQKHSFSEEYHTRLQKMNPEMCTFTQQQFEKVLFEFMCRNNYYYTKTYDHYVILCFNQELVGNRMIYHWKIKLRHRYENMKGYVFGKMNGARVRLKKYFTKRFKRIT